MGEHDHGIIIHDMAAHGDFLEVLAAPYGKLHRAFLIHDVHRAEVPAVHLDGLAVQLRGVAVALVERVRFHDIAVRHLSLERLHHVAGQDVRAVLFARVQLDGHLAVNTLIDEPVQTDQMLCIDVLREIDSGMRAFPVISAYAAAAHYGSLRKFFHSMSSFSENRNSVFFII